jgi:predicted Zn-dependent protease
MNTKTELTPAEKNLVEVATEMSNLMDAGKGVGSYLGYTEEDYALYEKNMYRLYKRGKYEDSKMIAQGLFQLDPTRAYPHFVLGDIELKASNLEGALDHFEKTLELAPESSMARVKIAEVSLRLDDKTRARTLLQEVVDNPKASQAQSRRAKAMLRLTA